jgi:thiol:disulfide interchange protein
MTLCASKILFEGETRMEHRVKSTRNVTLGLIAFLVTFFIAAPGHAAPKSKRPSIYDSQADGNKQISEALAVAKRKHKHVLLQFGADWCVWCHRLHGLFESNKDIARELRNEYELVLIDIDKVDGKMRNTDVVERYGSPTKHGLPVLMVLNAAGSPLTTRETASWEVGDDYDASKVLAFLKKWKSKPVSAHELLSAALAQAKSESKNVFLWFGAPWCSYCGLMSEFLDNADVKPIFGSAFVPIKIDIDRMTGGKELAEQNGRRDDDGLPFFVILDGAGQPLGHSRGPKGNVGFPVEPFEIEHFIKVIADTAKNLSPKQLGGIEIGVRKLKPDPQPTASQ